MSLKKQALKMSQQMPMASMPFNVWCEIKLIRCGMSHRDVAEKLGANESVISTALSGKNNMTLAKIGAIIIGMKELGAE